MSFAHRPASPFAQPNPTVTSNSCQYPSNILNSPGLIQYMHALIRLSGSSNLPADLEIVRRLASTCFIDNTIALSSRRVRLAHHHLPTGRSLESFRRTLSFKMYVSCSLH
ncbi:unnamed protein product [Protopolystoma xenopodis]|uniref:Uncharacterized protein n=1 Tax=Protopolystoma xenopodis TaxID=117903 RepID=A0A3S5FEW9_9PLAT|nr:unnamed protein product [Protopolystoma xenopodis]